MCKNILKTKKHLITHNWSIIKIVLLLCCRLLFMVSIPHSRSSSDPPTAIETPRWCKTKSHSAVLFQIPPDLVSSRDKDDNRVGSRRHEISVNVMHNGALAYWTVATACPWIMNLDDLYLYSQSSLMPCRTRQIFVRQLPLYKVGRPR